MGIWLCEFCSEEFDSELKALEHEMTCSKDIALAKEEEKKATKEREIQEKKKRIIEARENSKENYKGSKANLIEMHITLLLSLLGGMIGADRAYKGQFGLAFLKFITLGGLGLWIIGDIWINALEARESWHQYYICLDEDKPDEEA